MKWLVTKVAMVVRWFEILIHGWSMMCWYWFDLEYERGWL